MDKKVVAATAAITVIMGFTFLASSEMLIYANSYESAAIRWMFALLTMLILFAFKLIKIEFKGKNWLHALPVALCQPCIYAVAELEGMRLTTVAESAVILALVPVAVALIQVVAFKVKLGKVVAACIAISLAGVLLTVDYSQGFGGEVIGLLILFVAVFTGAMYSITSSRVSGEFVPIDLAFLQCVLGGIFLNIVVLLRGEIVETYSILIHQPTVILSGLYLGVVCSAIGYILWNYVLSRIPAHISALVLSNGITLIGVWIGVFFRGDHLTVLTVIGMILILIGVAGVALKKKEPDALE